MHGTQVRGGLHIQAKKLTESICVSITVASPLHHRYITVTLPLQAKKLTKSICVSNFNPRQLDVVIGMGGTVSVASDE